MPKIVRGSAEFAGLLALFAAITAIMFWQWMPHLTSALIGPPEDNQQDFWNSWYAAIAGKPGSFFFTHMLRFPEGTSLYYQSFAYPQVFAVAALSHLVGNDLSSLILLQNITLLMSFPLAGVGAFYLVRHFTPNFMAALLGGIVFAFNPSHIEHAMHHAHVASSEFIPFFVLSYLLALERHSVRWLAASIIFFVLNALSCWYYLFYSAYFMIFHFTYTWVRDRKFPRGWPLIAPIACGAGTFILLSPILIPMAIYILRSAVENPGGYNTFVADAAAYVAFPPTHLFSALTDGVYKLLTGYPWEDTVYLGLINIGLLAWFYTHAQKSQTRTYILWGMGVFAVIACGNTLHIFGHWFLPLPGGILSQIPFVDFVRAPARIIVFVYLFLSIAIGLAVTEIWQQTRPAMARLLVAGIAFLMVLDFYPAHIEMAPVSCSPGLALLRDDPDHDFGVLDLPSGYTEENAYMMRQVCHGRPIAQGNTSRNIAISLRDRLETHDLTAQHQQLVKARIKYILLSPPESYDFSWGNAKSAKQEQYLQAYPVAYRSADLTILRVY